MTQNNDVRYCPKCGERNSGVTNFCFACGNELVMNKENGQGGTYTEGEKAIDGTVDLGAPVEKVGEKIQDDLLTDNRKAAPDTVSAQTVADEKTDKSAKSSVLSDSAKSSEEQRADKPNGRVRRFSLPSYAGDATVLPEINRRDATDQLKKTSTVMLIISALLFLMFFAPFVKVRTEYMDGQYYDVRFSPAEFMKLSRNAMENHTNSSLKLTEEYIEYENLQSQIGNYAYDGTLTPYQSSLMEDYAEASMTIYLMRNVVSPKVNLVGAGALSLIYLVIAVVSSVLSIIGLALISRSGKHRMTHKVLNWGKRWTMVLTVLVPLCILVMMHAGHLCFGGYISDFGNRGVKMAWGGIMSLIVWIAFVLGTVYTCMVEYSEQKDSEKRFAAMIKGLALACAFVAVLSMFLSAIAVKIKTPSGYSGRYLIRASDIYEMGANDVNYYTSDTTSTTDEEFIDFVKGMANGGRKSRDVIKVFGLAVFREGDVSALFTLSSVIQILLMIILTVLMKRNLSCVLDQKQREKPAATLMLSAVLAFINLCLNIALSVVCYTNLGSEVGKYVLFSIGVGPILTVISIFAMIIVFVIRKPKERAPEYDNPDTSYAPYII